MPEEIQDLAHNILIDPVRVEVTPVASTVEKIAQSIFFVEKKDKPALLEHLLQDKDISRVLVFTRTKHGANKVVQRLEGARIHAEAIHGNKSQTARESALKNFKTGRTRVLVATDIAARGLDVEEITHIINYDLPNEPETYVHRIGRTARAGASGIAFSFCDTEERAYLRDIERLIKLHVPVVEEHPFQSPLPKPEPTDFNRRGGQRTQAPRPQNGERQQGQRSRRGEGRPQSGERQQGQRQHQPRPQQAQGERPQNGSPRPQAAQANRDNRPQGERRNHDKRDNNRSQGERPKFGNGSYNPQGAGARDDAYPKSNRRSDQPRENTYPQGSRPYGQRPQGQPSNSMGASGNGRPQGERRNDSRPQYNRSRPQRDNGAASEPSTIPTTPVRRKRPLPPPDQREQPVLTDRFGNPLPVKPKGTPSEE